MGTHYDPETIERLRNVVRRQAKQNAFPNPPATNEQVEATERRIGFRLPHLLRSVYLELGNGGFGSSCGGRLLGVEGGYRGDFGEMSDVYESAKTHPDSNHEVGVIPFYDWGCATLSYVDCTSDEHVVYLREQEVIGRLSYNLEWFFRMWIENVDILKFERVKEPTKWMHLPNPFKKGETRSILGWRKKKPE